VETAREDEAFGKQMIHGQPTVSLYFLVRQADLLLFRQSCAELLNSSSAKLLLSGPWPPYNFVS
jgi:hypothetical protein